MLLNSKGKKVTDPRKIAKSFNDHYTSVGPNIDKKIPKSLKKFHEYLRNIHVNKSFSEVLLLLEKYLTLSCLSISKNHLAQIVYLFTY